jgi:acyl carrier protein
MENSKFEKQVIRIVARVSGKDARTIRSHTTLIGDLGIDSASSLVLLVEFEDTFDVTVSDSAAAKMRTVGDILDYLRSLVKPA